MRIIDRYVMRQVLTPFALGLLVFTFLLIIPGLMEYAETFIAKGVPGPVVLRLMATLVPSSLGLTIPMAMLLGLLVAFGRLSADREFVAMQACGVSLMRLLRPVALVSVLSAAATGYVMLVMVPNGNQAFREIVFDIIAQRAEGEVRPRVFFDDFPDVVLYVREVPSSGAGWQGVFMADNRDGEGSSVYLATRGRVVIDRQRRALEMVLEDGTRHAAQPDGKYEVFRFDRTVLTLDPSTVFNESGPPRGDRELSIAELRAKAAELQAAGTYPHNQLFEIQKKFSIPAACLVFGLIGLALGASNRRDGKLASFVLGVVVIVGYYLLLSLGQSLVKGRLVPPWLAAWLPNIVLGAAGTLMFLWRRRLADQPLRIPLPAFLQRPPAAARVTRSASWRLPIGILDRYVAMTYARVLGLSALAMGGIFYVSTFVELSEKVFKGASTWTMLGAFMAYTTPQYLYYIIPLSVLLAALITIAMLTKNSELIVMKACGISLYRIALPMVVAAIGAGAILFALEQTILGPANRTAKEIRHVMNGNPPETFDVMLRRWVAGTDGDIYHYNYYDPRTRTLATVSIYEFTGDMRRFTRRSFADVAVFKPQGGLVPDAWQLERGWTREFADNGEPRSYAPFDVAERQIESAAYFSTETPDPEFMSYSQLRGYIDRLKASGVDVLEQQVALARKVSFPFVTLVMTLIAVPFAVTMGRSGAMAGIGVAIAIAITYWTTISVFAAMGSGGLIAPTLAAWAPNLLFGAGAGYLLLTVRT